MSGTNSFLEATREPFTAEVRRNGLLQESVVVTPGIQETVHGSGIARSGAPVFIRENEDLAHARVSTSSGFAYSALSGKYEGTLRDVLVLPLKNDTERTVYLACLNAVWRKAGRILDTPGCGGDSPGECGRLLARGVRNHLGENPVSIVGFPEEFSARFAGEFGEEKTRIVRWNEDMDGSFTQATSAMADSEGALIAGAVLVTGGFDALWNVLEQNQIPFLLCGESAVAFAEILQFDLLRTAGE